MRLLVGLPLLTAALLAVMSGWLGTAAAAQNDSQDKDTDAVVLVVDNAYDDGDDDPNRTVVRAGDRVEWRWAQKNENRHTVSAFDGNFDSDPGCGTEGDECGHVRRDPFRVTFNEPGRYPYRCRVHGVQMTGLIVVEERASESETASPSPSSSPSPTETTSSQSPSPTPSANPSGGSASPTPSPTPSPSDDETTGSADEAATESANDDTSTDGGTRSFPRTASGPVAGVRETFAPGPNRSHDPSTRPAAVASPSFAPFPSPSEAGTASPSPTEESTVADMAVDVPVDGSPSPLLVGIAIGSVTLSAGAFAKFVLFANI